jgi:hypothetical protein
MSRWRSSCRPPINLVRSGDEHISETARRITGEGETDIRRTAILMVDGQDGDAGRLERGVWPVAYAAVIVLYGMRVGGNRVRAVQPVSDYLTDLALKIPVVPVTVVRLPVFGTHGFGWQGDYCRVWRACCGHGGSFLKSQEVRSSNYGAYMVHAQLA